MNGIVVTKGISREFDCTPQVRYICGAVTRIIHWITADVWIFYSE